MKQKTKQWLLYTLVVLGIVGFITSAYLVKNHYNPPLGGSFCDVGETISCSLVNTSVFSKLFNVPVALFGALWFLFLGLMSWKALKKESLFWGLAAWNVLGLVFVIYLVVAEIILRAVCPLCTFVHVLVIASLVISFVLYKSSKKLKQKELIKTLKPWIGSAIVVFVLPLVILNFPTGDHANYDDLAKCMNEKGVVMYGSFRCGVCAKTRAMFGDSFEYITEIECHPQGKNAQTDLCLEKGIEGTPTWMLEQDGNEIKKHTGFLSIEELREFSGCTE